MAARLPAPTPPGLGLRDAWQPIQDGLARLSGLRLELLGESGESLSTPSGQIPPALERTGATGRERAVLAARLRGEPVIYAAPTGLAAFVAPIDTPHGRAFLSGGYAFPALPDEGHRQRLARDLGLEPAALETLVGSIPVVTPVAFRSLVQTLDRVARAALGGLGDVARSQRQIDRAASLFSLVPELADARVSREGETPERVVLQALAVLFDIPAAAILLRDPAEAVYHSVAGYGTEGLDLSSLVVRPGGAGPFARALAAPSGPTRAIETREVYEILKSGFPADVQSVHAFPMAEPAAMVLVLMNADLAPAELELIAGFARQAGMALEARRLRTMVERREHELAALVRIGEAVSAALDSHELFRVILDSAARTVGADLGSLMLLDETRGDYAIKATRGLNERIVEQFRIRPGEGIAGQVAASGRAILVRDIEADARVGRRNRPRFRSRSFVSLPIRVKDRAIGILNLADKEGGVFDEADLALLRAVAAQAAVAIERSSFYERSEALKQISITDGLTGLLNRHYFEERLTEEMDRASRTKSQVSLVMIDIDGFKSFNDTHGHLSGDEALRLTAGTIRSAVRTMDIVARYGGEEFAVILPETGRQEASSIAERILHEVEALVHTVDGGQVRLTISAGVAEFPADAASLRELIVRADRALYSAKAAGKNRIAITSGR
jgi:diguanylate cyclase (GGDEF)-like protein